MAASMGMDDRSPAARMLRECAASTERYEVLAVHQGSLDTLRSHVYLNHDLYGEADGEMTIDYFFWVLRSAERTVLVDTGMSESGARSRGRRFERTTSDALADLGIRPEDVERVILTHAHYDHAGGLRELPGVRITASVAELAFWRDARSQRSLLRSVVDDDDLAVIDAAEAAGIVDAIDEASVIAPGIAAILAPGHTPGELAVLVRTRKGVVVLAGDATHFDEELARDMPFRHQTDLLAMYDSLAVLRELSDDPAVSEVVAGHDGAVRARHRSLPALDHVTVIAER
ncbi:N-acyl homoserine lactonase family protein [Microbacterium sp. A1-JK]|uniref:N-acyl homoserine lactonase family protein n=1 Tax=Microbacterium sp. A1-JK TaxID=3177516 RepID=UPI003884FB17